MSAEQIRKYFTRFIGVDVGVSFNDPANPCEVILYRPDQLSEAFVLWAFEELEKAAPDVARRIDRLLVSYETPLGRTQRGINIALVDRARQLSSGKSASRTDISGPAA